MLQSKFKKISFDDLRIAIVTCDFTCLTASDLNALKQYVPTKEEIKVLEDYDGDLALLPPPERWFLKIKDIAATLEQRLECLEYMQMFEEIVMDVQPFIQCGYFALKQMNSSKKLKAVLRMILKIGNYMNGGSQRGGAYGFSFQSIEKLKDTKSTDNKHSLIHYLWFQIEKEQHEYLRDWTEELPQVSLATKVSMDLLKPRLGVLSKGVRDITVLLRDYQPIDADDTFVAAMEPFLALAADRTKMVERDFDRLEREYKEFLGLWLLEESQMPLETAFIMIDNFMSDYLRAGKEIMDEREAEAKRERLAAAKAQADAEKAASKASGQTNQRAQVAPVGLQDMTAAIKSGKAFNRDTSTTTTTTTTTTTETK